MTLMLVQVLFYLRFKNIVLQSYTLFAIEVVGEHVWIPFNISVPKGSTFPLELAVITPTVKNKITTRDGVMYNET